jgi:cytochrome c oxidase cbb3-type subunit 3
MKKIIILPALLLSSIALTAQDGSANTAFFSDLFVQIIVVSAIVVFLVALFVLYRTLNAVLEIEKRKIFEEKGIPYDAETKSVQRGPSLWSVIYDKLTGAVPVQQEYDVMLDHDYDGIRELDNKLPPWWVAMFYITIIWGLAYLVYYHVGDGPSSYEEYVEEVRVGEEMAEAYLAKQADVVDENSVQRIEDPSVLATAENIFLGNCAVCHGQAGEGGVGPNLTDDYYIHGGSVQDIFKVIKYGVPEKGMISWKSQIRPADMQALASYIMNLRGTTPPNPKDPEGELFVPESEGTEGEETTQEGEEAI